MQSVSAPRGKAGARLNAHTELRTKRQRSAREAIYRNRPIAPPHLIAGQHATAAANCGDVTDEGTLPRGERYEVGVEPAAAHREVPAEGAVEEVDGGAGGGAGQRRGHRGGVAGGLDGAAQPAVGDVALKHRVVGATLASLDSIRHRLQQETNKSDPGHRQSGQGFQLAPPHRVDGDKVRLSRDLDGASLPAKRHGVALEVAPMQEGR